MNISLEQLENLLESSEDENLEFKEAKQAFDKKLLFKYCVALANEKGGKLILGVTDKKPRVVVGTDAFKNPDDIKMKIYDTLKLHIATCEIPHPDGRVLVFDIPSRPIGKPLGYEGAFWCRLADAVVPMSAEQIIKICDEGKREFSAEICPNATLDDLSEEAIKIFRRLWIEKSKNKSLEEISTEQLLIDSGLVYDDKITNAAIVLLGTSQALRRHIPQAEVIFEYRNNESRIESNQRIEFRDGFFLFFDKLWNTINLRNDLHQYQDGLFQKSIPTFNEAVVREAILNAISHREYRDLGSVFLKQYPSKLEIISPGGLPDGITPENILWNQKPRNGRIAEILQKCGLVERSGQGFDRIYEFCIKESKPLPDLSGTDDYKVCLTLRGEVQDERFVRFLEEMIEETQANFGIEDFLILDLLHRNEALPNNLKKRLPFLVEKGVIEKIGRTKDSRYIISRRFHSFIKEPERYTRQKGLDNETNKTLLERHIRENPGCRFSEIRGVLPSHSDSQVQRLMRELKDEGRIYLTGSRKSSKWFSSNNSENGKSIKKV